MATVTDWERLYKLLDQIYETLLAELGNNHEIHRETLGNLIGFPQARYAALWPKHRPNFQNTPPAGVEAAYELASQFAKRLNRLRGRRAYSKKISEDPLVPPQRHLLVDGIPHRRTDGSVFIEEAILNHYAARKKDAGNGPLSPAPIIYVSPVHMRNVDAIIGELFNRIPRNTPITDVIQAMKLKLISPELARFLERAGLMEGYQNELKGQIKVIQDRFGMSFSMSPDPNSSKWLSVHSYWERLPPVHGMYIQGFDFLHITPYAPSMEGMLHAWIAGSYRLYEKDCPDAFQLLKKALVSVDKPTDWSWLAKIKGPKRP